jgi:poly(hydroxyalkanoate) granule-associated protein
MATKTKPVVEETEEEMERNPLFESSRRVLLAGIGAFALAQDEIEDFVDKLVERGEIAEKDGKKLVREVMDKRKKTSKNAEGEMNKRVQNVLDHLNVPTKSDIESLGEKIATLTKKVDELKKTQA